ncbi:DUF2065 domain-containing protein [Desulfovibrio inopinatus]|uniref:DUF2065 domain-containing protein n=1 Tax=Desulfovibrio inopinatus TaxID=102109 RepID=UPI000488E2D8|nr:DUF2065 domain-containing protein [Desulfovibrio inopinatus]
MNFDWRFFLTALGLAFILEGLPYFVAAEKMPKILKMMSERPPSALRGVGISAIVAGLAVIYLARTFFG